MKKTHIFLSLLFAVTASFTACSDDNEITKPTQPTADEVEQTQSAKLYATDHIMRPLAGLDALPDNWDTAIFTPTEGVVTDEATPEVRSVIATDLAGAEQYFRDLCPDLDEGATTWTGDSVGSLKFTKVGTDQCFATIDVDLKQMPGLKQIRLVPENVIPANSKFDGVPYYHMGDIVTDEKGIYWICVRPSGGPLKKEYSYFVSFDKSLLKYKTQNQDIYQYTTDDDNVTKKLKDKQTETSGKWNYATNLVEEKVAIAAMQTFFVLGRQLDVRKEAGLEKAEEARQLLVNLGFDFSKLIQADYDEFPMLHAAYGTYKSSGSKFLQEKYIQPVIKFRFGTYKSLLDDRCLDEDIFTHYFIDAYQSKNTWLNYTLTSAHTQNIGVIDRHPWSGKKYGYATPFDINDYTTEVTSKGINVSNTKTFKPANDGLDYPVLVMTQKKITDKGQPYKKFKIVVSPLAGYSVDGQDFYYHTLKRTRRKLFDKTYEKTREAIVIDDIEE